MATNGLVGSVAGLWRFPVKSMRGEQLEQTNLEARGLVGDRGYALIDVETGKVVSAKSVRLFPDLLNCTAAFVEPPQSGRDLPPVRISLPDGTVGGQRFKRGRPYAVRLFPERGDAGIGRTG